MAQNRAELLATLARGMAAAGESVPGDWEGFSVVAEITALGVRVTGFRYSALRPGQPMLMDSAVIQTIADLRMASLGPHGELFDVYVARLDRQSGDIVDQAFAAENGAGYRVTAANVARIAALVRPGLPFLPPSPSGSMAPPMPVPPVTTEPEPAPEPEMAEPTEPIEPEPIEPEPLEPDPIVDESPADGPFATLTRIILADPDLRGSDWFAYGGVVSFGEVSSAIGFRYGDAGATPTFVGAGFLPELVALREANADVDGERPGAALIRLPARDAQVQVRFIYGPEAAQISWTGADDMTADRLRPDSVTTSTAVVRRPAPDLLPPTALLARIRSDITASLRARDGWRSFALGVDVARNRAAAFVYTDEGVPVRHQPILSPLPDLAELRAQTARPDGSQWAGATILSWRTGGDRVDLNFYGDAGINEYLGRGPDAAGMALRPNADPPETEPRIPWPPAGGYLDQAALVASITAAVLSSPALAGDDWDRLAVVVAFMSDEPTVTALRYRGDSPAVLTEIPQPGPIGKLRRSNPNERGWLWDACVLSAFRGAPSLHPEFFYGGDAEQYRVDDRSVQFIADRLRPV